MATIRDDGVLLCDRCDKAIRRGTYAVVEAVVQIDGTDVAPNGEPFARFRSRASNESIYHLACSVGHADGDAEDADSALDMTSDERVEVRRYLAGLREESDEDEAD